MPQCYYWQDILLLQFEKVFRSSLMNELLVVIVSGKKEEKDSLFLTLHPHLVKTCSAVSFK